ncbi:hypothetical protein MK280_08380 [Myxococcota bacterium]|nr:hypothetical protein [Myxococcota bacterium]
MLQPFALRGGEKIFEPNAMPGVLCVVVIADRGRHHGETDESFVGRLTASEVDDPRLWCSQTYPDSHRFAMACATRIGFAVNPVHV